jgi:hypothetical protein
LRIFDVEELLTHGGSLRVYGSHDNDQRTISRSVAAMLELELQSGLRSLETYKGVQRRAETVKNGLLQFLLDHWQAGKSIAAYGAAAKGSTLLNYAGVKADLLPYVCDAAPSKQGKFLPGSHIPIVGPASLKQLKPDVVLIMPWNIADEVAGQHSYIREWGGRFAVAVPSVNELP